VPLPDVPLPDVPLPDVPVPDVPLPEAPPGFAGSVFGFWSKVTGASVGLNHCSRSIDLKKSSAHFSLSASSAASEKLMTLMLMTPSCLSFSKAMSIPASR
jgi:hypothetical protein